MPTGLMKIAKFFQILVVMFLCTNISFGQDFKEDSCYRLTNYWRGDELFLGAFNDRGMSTPLLGKTGDVFCEAWKITKVENGIYTLSTELLGPENKLGIGPNQEKPVLSAFASIAIGNKWKITPLGEGYYKITNVWLSDFSLDIVNEGENSKKIQVAKTGDYSGQAWKIMEIK